MVKKFGEVSVGHHSILAGCCAAYSDAVGGGGVFDLVCEAGQEQGLDQLGNGGAELFHREENRVERSGLD